MTNHKVGLRRLFTERTRRDERGYVLALAAILLIPLLTISAMAIDFGAWYSTGSKMQKAADAAALAGVIWLPNLATATTVAKDTAKANGYDDSLASVTVTVTKVSDTELRVQITDTNSPVYLARFLKQNVTISRTAQSEYVLEVPLGSPKNYFGTGQMLSSPNTENFFAAINGYCAYKAQGGPFEAQYRGTGSGSGNACTGSDRIDNGEYKDDPDAAYRYYVELPASRTQSMQLYIFDPEYDSGDPAYTSGNANAEFWLQAPDTTPLNDSDNPIYTGCSGTGETNSTTAPLGREYTAGDNDASFMGNSGWSRFCTFSTTAPAGKYILNVRTDEGASNSVGSNAFSLFVQRGTSTSTATICDTRTDTGCPAVYGKSWMSVYANSSSTSANFFLAKIGPEHSGKTLKITLFDPGEGGSTIRILDPAGAYVSFTAQDMGVDGTAPGTSYASSTSLNVANGTFNGKYVDLTIPLLTTYGTNSAYSTAGWWWKIQYNFGSGDVTDRTTWGVKVIGDPVHLTE